MERISELGLSLVACTVCGKECARVDCKVVGIRGVGVKEERIFVCDSCRKGTEDENEY